MPEETRVQQLERRKAELKQDHFVTTTGSGLAWASENRRSVILTSALLLAAIVIVVAIAVFASHRSDVASAAFGDAMEVYQTPLAVPGQPAMPNTKTFPSALDRARAANQAFVAVADKYGSTQAGKNARYFAGLTYMDEGQTQSAESTLKQVADGWDHDLAALAKLSLADVYRQTGRSAQAIELYNQLTAKPTDTVSAGLAQIQLAELYTAQGKTDEARRIYAQLKDKDKDAKGNAGAAGAIAAQKLNPAATPAPQM